MVETTANTARKWRKLMYAALVAFAVFVPIAFCQSDLALLLYFVVGAFAVVISAALLITIAIRKKRSQFISLISMLAVFWVISAGLVVYDLKNPVAIRTTARWLIWSQDYKSAVLAQPASANGEFKHIEWDGWGWAGMDTTVYLVFDPTDSLSAAPSHRPGQLKGIPCEVNRVRRLESRWYTVLLYTDEFWDRCN